MTEFKTAMELSTRMAKKPRTKRSSMWSMEADFIRDLAANEGKYARYPKVFDTYNSAYLFGDNILRRVRHSFQEKVCNLPGWFDPVITESNGEYHVWIAYKTSEGTEDSNA